MSSTSKTNPANYANKVTQIDYQECKIHLIGAAHFSENSNRLVTETIKEVRPDAIFLELCDERKQISTWTDEEILAEFENRRKPGVSLPEAIRAGKILDFLLMVASSEVQMNLKMLPGGEMRAAYRACREQTDPECAVIYGDRALSQTIKRAFNPLSYYQKLRLAYSLIEGIKEAQEITQSEVEKLMEDSDKITEYIQETGKEYPEFAKALIDERNIYMAGNLQSHSTKYKQIVAVMGAGHIPGITEIFNNDIKIENRQMRDLRHIPPPYRWSRNAKIAIFAGGTTALCMAIPSLRRRISNCIWKLRNGVSSCLG